VIAVLSILVFVPIGYLYPSRQPFLRPLTVALGAAWGVAVIVSVFQLPRPSPLLVWSSLLYPGYYLGLSFYLHYTRR
jgi:phosphatidylcholine synthase